LEHKIAESGVFASLQVCFEVIRCKASADCTHRVLEEVVDGNGGTEKYAYFSERVFLVIIFYKRSEGRGTFARKKAKAEEVR
jgi:hypothetical protein